MNKRKGFTMIELLAVIIILAVVITIATFAVLTFLQNSRETTCENLEATILREAETFVIRENRDATGVHNLTLDDICRDGLIECPVINPMTNNEVPSSLPVMVTINQNGVVTDSRIDLGC